MNVAHADTRKYSLAPSGSVKAAPPAPIWLPDMTDAGRLARLNRFKHRASIDFMEIVVVAKGWTQKRHLQRRLPKCWGSYVKEVDRETQTYLVRVNDPPVDVAEIYQALADAYIETESAIRIAAIEISLDAKPKRDAKPEDLIDFAFDSITTMGRPLTDLRVTTKLTGVGRGMGKGRRKATETTIGRDTKTLIEKLGMQATCYVGHKTDRVKYRCYIKRTDRRVELPEDEICVRHEVTIRDPNLLPRDLSELATFRFEELSDLMPVLREALSPVEPGSVRAELRRKLTLLAPVLAKRWPATVQRRLKGRQVRRFSKFQQRRVYEPLRRLSERITDSRFVTHP